jgi:hypothetical protein
VADEGAGRRDPVKRLVGLAHPFPHPLRADALVQAREDGLDLPDIGVGGGGSVACHAGFPALKHRETLGDGVDSGRGTPRRDGKVIVNLSPRIEAVLGPPGRLLSGSKTAYSRAHPDHEVLFNACAFACEAGEEDDAVEVWFGDIDLTLERDLVQRAADAVGVRLLLTPEQPFRFEGLAAGLDSYTADRVRVFEPGRAAPVTQPGRPADSGGLR